LIGAARETLKVLIALRADYYGRVLEQDGLGRAIEAAQVTLLPMVPKELRTAIIEPARALFRRIQTSVIDDMVSDVSERAGDLPLLQFTLTELWTRDNAKGILTAASYEDLGPKDEHGKVTVSGVRGTVIQRAEEYFLKLSPEQRERFNRLFRLLVSSVQSSGRNRDISRRVIESELDDKTREMADQLADTFLLTAGEDAPTKKRTYEVAHEALIRSWPRLKNLSEKEQSWAIWYETVLFPAFSQWLQRKKIADHLISAPPVLTEAQTWLDDDNDMSEAQRRLTGDVRTFVESSLRAAKDRADKDRRDRGRQRKMSQGLALLAVVILVAAGFLWQSLSQGRVVAARDFNERGILALQAHQDLESQLFFAKAITLDDRLESRERLVESLGPGVSLNLLRSYEGDVVAIAPNTNTVVTNANRKLQLLSTIEQSKSSDSPFPSYLGLLLRASISADGRWIAWETHADPNGASAIPSLLHLWDCAAQQDHPYDAGDRPVSAMTFSPDSDLFAFANERGVIRLIDLPSLRERPEPLRAHKAPIWGLAISRKNTHLASCGTNLELRLWNLEDHTQVQLFGHTDVIYSVAFSSDGNVLASGSTDSTVRLWNVGNPKELPRVLKGDQGQINCLAFSPGGELVAGGGEDRSIRIWDTSIGFEVHRFPVEDGNNEISQIAFTPDGGGLAAGGRGGWFRRWRLDNWSVNHRISNEMTAGTAVAFSNDSHYLFAAGQDGVVRQFSWPKCELVSRLCPPGARVLCLVSNDKTSTLCWATDANIVHLYDYSKSEETQRIDLTQPNPEQIGFQQIWSVAFSRDGRRLAVANFDHSIKVYERPSDKAAFDFKQTFTQQKGAVFALAFGNDSSSLASAGGDSAVHLWKINSKDEPIPLSSHTNEVWGLAVNSTGTLIASSDNDKKIHIWDVERHQDVKILKGHSGSIFTVAFSPLGRWLASGSNDRTVRFWDLSANKCLVLRGANGPVWWAAFSPDGKSLAAAGLDGQINVWNVGEIERLLATAPAVLLKESVNRSGETIDDVGVVSVAVPASAAPAVPEPSPPFGLVTPIDIVLQAL
jgi:WD40 repeat protein